MLTSNFVYRALAAFRTGGRAIGVGSAIMLLSVPLASHGDDWPQWRGPHRNGISAEKGWLTQWPASGPQRLWEAKVGVGYSSYSVSQGRLYTMGNNRNVDSVYCLNAETGQPIWEHQYPCNAKDRNGYHGTRVTPTVDGDRVYSVSREGHLFCLEAATGKVIWAKEYSKDFGAKQPDPWWGYSGSPLIEQDWVLVEPGAPGASVVALDKQTGAVIWKNGDDPAGYSSLMAFDHNGQRCLAVFSREFIVGRSMKDGRELWRHKWKTNYGVNAATPIIEGDTVFISSGYNTGATRLRLTATGVEEIWRNKDMRNHVNSCVLWADHLYGFDDNKLNCLDFKTGALKWSDGSYGKGSLMVADGKLILYGDRGKLGLAELTPTAFKEIASAQILAGKDTWAAPVLANGRLYVRSLEDLVALDVRGR